MPRFVVLEHCLPPGHARDLHWDLMLEAPGGLRTWALSAAPASGAQIAAEQLPPHRIEFLDYQGPVSGGRGSVQRWDQGSFRWLVDVPQRVEIHFQGSRLSGRAVLEQL
ncbi:MAG TPA: DNA polymerase ligase N-terminal domain-containing protein, partial [Pirellulales bacterium]|nr:DNA polymerase ligase N-terminal domain-containing protein [Pirellulales bacterium]